MFKKCNKCTVEKPITDFYANKRMKDGWNTFCILCHKADNVARKAKNRADAEFRTKEQAYKKLYRERTIEQRAAAIALWREKNKQHTLEYGKNYRTNNKSKYNYLCQLRKIALMQRTPVWLTEDDRWMLEQAYELAAQRTEMFGFSWHVDHTIPLRGKTVSGLHVPNNIRVIPGLENMRKTNKFEV